MFGLLALKTFPAPGLDLRPRIGKFGKPFLAPRQLLRNRHPIGDIRLIRGFRPRQQVGHFSLLLRLDRHHDGAVFHSVLRGAGSVPRAA